MRDFVELNLVGGGLLFIRPETILSVSQPDGLHGLVEIETDHNQAYRVADPINAVCERIELES